MHAYLQADDDTSRLLKFSKNEHQYSGGNIKQSSDSVSWTNLFVERHAGYISTRGHPVLCMNLAGSIQALSALRSNDILRYEGQTFCEKSVICNTWS